MFLSRLKVCLSPASRGHLIAAVTVSVALVGVSALVWLDDPERGPAYCRLELAFLRFLEAGYLAALAVVLLGLPILSMLIIRGSRAKPRQRSVLRGLCATFSLALGLVLAEAVSAVWIARAGRPVVPAGGLRQSMLVDRQTLWPPVTMSDVSLPDTFDDPPGDPTLDLVVVGESSALGVPYQKWLSIGQIVAWQLELAVPERPARVQMVATSGDILELQHQRLAKLRRRPDLMIVYCGHNEFASRLNGARDVVHYDDDQAPAGFGLMVDEVESRSALCGLIHQAEEKCRLQLPPAPTGRRGLVDTPVYTPAEYTLLLTDFRRRLDAIAAFAERVRATAVFVIPPANDAGFEPSRSYLPASTPRWRRAAFQHEFEAAAALEARDPVAAIAAYRALLTGQPGFAEAHYRLARLLDQTGDLEGAYAHYVAARDHDGYPVRCMSAFQNVYREVAARHDVILVDGQAELHAIGFRGMLDDRLFQDAMHPSLRGQIALAQAILRQLCSRRALGWPADRPAPRVDPAQCARHFGVDRDAWKDICLWGTHFGAYASGLRYDPAPRRLRQRIYSEAYDRLVAGAAVESLGLSNVGIPEPVPAVDGAGVIRNAGSG